MIQYVDACDCLAESFEAEGYPDLAFLCDRAAFWLSGTTCTADDARSLVLPPHDLDAERKALALAAQQLDGPAVRALTVLATSWRL